MPGGKKTYKDNQGNEPEEPPGGWVKAGVKSELGEYLVDLIEKGIVTSVSTIVVIFVPCDSIDNIASSLL